MNVSDFDFDLPEDLIAQAPTAVRGASRLLVLRKSSGEIEHTRRGAPSRISSPRRSPRRQRHARCFLLGSSARGCRAAAPSSACCWRPSARADGTRSFIPARSCSRDRASYFGRDDLLAARRDSRASFPRTPDDSALDRRTDMSVEEAIDRARPRAAAALHQA